MESRLDRVGRDPALLAFIKCHVTSPTRWNALRVLAECPGDWRGAADVARAVDRPAESVRVTLRDLARERLIQQQRGTGGPAYRLDPAEPTSRVVARLVSEATRNPGLRRVIVAQLLTSDAVREAPGGSARAAGRCA